MTATITLSHPSILSQDTGTATSGGNTTIVDTGGGWTPDAWIGYVVLITGGTGAGQSGWITDNDATTLTVGTAWDTNPDSTSTYSIVKPVVIQSAKLERVIDNKVVTVPIPDFDTTSKPVVGLMNLKSFNLSFLVSGYVVKNTPQYANPFDEMNILYQMSYDNSGLAALSWRGYTFNGMVKKVQVVDSFSGDFSTLAEGEIGFEIMFMFLEGVDITNI